jgi:hypothetical protein
MLQGFNFLAHFNQQVTIPLEFSQDKLIWKHADSGELMLKDAYHFLSSSVSRIILDKFNLESRYSSIKIYFGLEINAGESSNW